MYKKIVTTGFLLAAFCGVQASLEERLNSALLKQNFEDAKNFFKDHKKGGRNDSLNFSKEHYFLIMNHVTKLEGHLKNAGFEPLYFDEKMRTRSILGICLSFLELCPCDCFKISMADVRLGSAIDSIEYRFPTMLAIEPEPVIDRYLDEKND
ncbi:MAG: hypothetical protein Q8Q60_01305 [Candidatus Chromulinivorax sp.]|nr:hypothetical protein [Candidatus Chromulinivorax sp.]